MLFYEHWWLLPISQSVSFLVNGANMECTGIIQEGYKQQRYGDKQQNVFLRNMKV